MKKFAAFDLDGTLIRWQLYHTVVDRLAALGYLGDTAAQDIRDARMRWKTRSASFKEYELVLLAAYESALKNVPIDEFENAVSLVVSEYKNQVYTYTRELLKDLQAQGYFTMAISGSHHEMVAEVAREYGFDDFMGTVYSRKDGRFTGDMDSFPVADKAKALAQLVAKHSLTYDDSYAIGDSESDIPMLASVQNPIAFNPERGLFEKARAQKWKIIVERKNVVYQLLPGESEYTLV